MIERFIDSLEGVVWSVVCIQYPRATFPRMRGTRPSAFVYLESEADRLLPSQTVRAIPAILLGNVPDLCLEAITMMDRKGRSYLDPRNPEAGRQTREEELRQKIVERLPWLKGVQVWVELTDRRDGVAGAAEACLEPGGRSGRAGPRRDGHRAAPAIVVNRPAEAGGEPAPPVDPADSRAEKVEGGRVFVYVPRSYYFSRIAPGAEHREPTVEELHDAAARTRDQIEKLVHLVVPESWAVLIDTFADEVPDDPHGRAAGRVGTPPDRDRLGDRRGGRGVGRAADGDGVVDPGRPPAVAGDRVARRRAGVSRGLGRRARALGAGPRAGPARPRGRRQRPPAMGDPGGAGLMTTTRPDYHPSASGSRRAGRCRGDGRPRRGPPAHDAWPAGGDAEPSPLRKAAIVLVSLEQSLASQLLSHLDRSAVETVTWEIARLERVDPEERAAVLEEFYGLGLRRLCFVFDDLIQMGDADIRAAFHEEDIETWALAAGRRVGDGAGQGARLAVGLGVGRAEAAARGPRAVPALRLRGRPARDRRPAPAAPRPRLDQPPRAEWAAMRSSSDGGAERIDSRWKIRKFK